MAVRIRACWQLSCRIRFDREMTCKSGRIVQGVRSPTGSWRAVSVTDGQRRYSILPLYCLDKCVCLCACACVCVCVCVFVCCEVANSSTCTYFQIISLSDITRFATSSSSSYRLSFASHDTVSCCCTDSHSLLLHRQSKPAVAQAITSSCCTITTCSCTESHNLLLHRQ